MAKSRIFVVEFETRHCLTEVIFPAGTCVTQAVGSYFIITAIIGQDYNYAVADYYLNFPQYTINYNSQVQIFTYVFCFRRDKKSIIYNQKRNQQSFSDCIYN